MADTIAAIATPSGEGGIAVIRISGDNALIIADKVFAAKNGESLSASKGYRAHFGDVTDKNGVIDECVATVFIAPKSYTGENSVELSVHGGRQTALQTLRSVISVGARLAEPGEFTKRSFLNGKKDLLSAEAVAEVIAADNSRALKAASTAADGRVTQKIKDIKDRVLSAAGKIAAFSDFPDEDESFSGIDTLDDDLAFAEKELMALLENYDNGRAIVGGVKTAIVGKPNVGKSTLMNSFTGFSRSIVTDIAGTTRDVIEETVNLGSVKLRLCDTAGIRETDDKVESIGVELSKKYMSEADLVLAVFEAGEFGEDDKRLLKETENQNTICVINKSDKAAADILPFEKSGLPFVLISAKNGEGIEKLSSIIEEVTGAAKLSDDALMFPSERARECANMALLAVSEAKKAKKSGISLDAVGILIDDALSALLSLTGERVTEATANEVFSKFCVGK